MASKVCSISWNLKRLEHRVSFQKKWFKSAFSSDSLTSDSLEECSRKRAKKNDFHRTLSESDSINLSITGIELPEKTIRLNNNSKIDESASVSPVSIVHSDFKSSNWIENFAPQTRAELALHAKKIQELEDWFRSSRLNEKKCRAPILLVTGPSGAGKTVALKVLANEFQYSISEWITPIDIEYSRGYGNENVLFSESQTDKFIEFLMHSSRYGSLFDACQKRLVLVEDFPNVFIKDSESFAGVLEQYAAYGKSPLVFVVTDTKSRSLNVSHSVFSDELRQRFAIATINFNPVSDTMVRKGLKRICEIMKQPGFQKYYDEPSADAMENIIFSSQGDLRNAVINLHFATQKSESASRIPNALKAFNDFDL